MLAGFVTPPPRLAVPLPPGQGDHEAIAQSCKWTKRFELELNCGTVQWSSVLQYSELGLGYGHHFPIAKNMILICEDWRQLPSSLAPMHARNGSTSVTGHSTVDTFQDFFDCLANPNLSASLATDQKWHFSCLCISYQSLAQCHLP